MSNICFPTHCNTGPETRSGSTPFFRGARRWTTRTPRNRFPCPSLGFPSRCSPRFPDNSISCTGRRSRRPETPCNRKSRSVQKRFNRTGMSIRGHSPGQQMGGVGTEKPTFLVFRDEFGRARVLAHRRVVSVELVLLHSARVQYLIGSSQKRQLVTVRPVVRTLFRGPPQQRVSLDGTVDRVQVRVHVRRYYLQSGIVVDQHHVSSAIAVVLIRKLDDRRRRFLRRRRRQNKNNGNVKSNVFVSSRPLIFYRRVLIFYFR